MSESPSDRAKRRRQAAAAATVTPEVPNAMEPLRAALQTTTIYGRRKQILISVDQEKRIKRLAYEKGLKETEVIRRMIDHTPDDAV